MCDHSIYILYSSSSKDLQSSVRPVINLLHALKLVLRELNSTNPAKIVRKCLGAERFSQISRIRRAKLESPLKCRLYDRCMNGCTKAFVLKEDPEGTSCSRTSSRDLRETGPSIGKPKPIE